MQIMIIVTFLAPVVQILDPTPNKLNHFSTVKEYWGNQLRYPLDNDLSGEKHYRSFDTKRSRISGESFFGTVGSINIIY